MEGHGRTVQREFARQAAGFRERRTLFADRRLADWMARGAARPTIEQRRLLVAARA